jgi:hypothetical protein
MEVASMVPALIGSKKLSDLSALLRLTRGRINDFYKNCEVLHTTIWNGLKANIGRECVPMDRGARL